LAVIVIKSIRTSASFHWVTLASEAFALAQSSKAGAGAACHMEHLNCQETLAAPQLIDKRLSISAGQSIKILELWFRCPAAHLKPTIHHSPVGLRAHTTYTTFLSL